MDLPCICYKILKWVLWMSLYVCFPCTLVTKGIRNKDLMYVEFSKVIVPETHCLWWVIGACLDAV